MTHAAKLLLTVALASVLPVSHSFGQGFTLGAGETGLSIGNTPRAKGVRINFRDRGLEYVHGINITVWSPHRPVTGEVSGAALGLLLTGADRIRGLSYGVLGVAAETSLEGVGFGGLGLGAGQTVTGVFIGGLGVGSGQDLSGIVLGGLGAGAGRDARGVMVGGLGAGAGQDLEGAVVGGLGAGAGRDLRGIVVGGLGAGAGRDFEGVAVGGLGVGAGRDVTGLLIAGVGAGAGGTLRGVAIAGLAAGAPTVEGLVIAPAAGGEHVTGVLIAPGYVRIEPGGVMSGFSLSAFNHVRGEAIGLTIGIFNYARSLNGVQIGLLNYAGNNRSGLRWLPLLNAHFH